MNLTSRTWPATVLLDRDQNASRVAQIARHSKALSSITCWRMPSNLPNPATQSSYGLSKMAHTRSSRSRIRVPASRRMSRTSFGRSFIAAKTRMGFRAAGWGWHWSRRSSCATRAKSVYAPARAKGRFLPFGCQANYSVEKHTQSKKAASAAFFDSFMLSFSSPC